MLRLIQGGCGCGKSYEIAREIRQLAEEGKEAILLVPEQFSFETEREYWTRLGAALSARVQVLSFERLAQESFRLYGGLAGNYASDTMKLLLMREALRAVRPALHLYGKNAARPEFVSQMLAMAEELKRASVTPIMLEEQAAACESKALGEKLADLSLVTGGYEALMARSFLDPSDNLERAVGQLREHHFFLGKRIYVDMFKSFTARQLEILGLAMREGEQVAVALCLPEEPGSGLFDGIQETRRRLLRLAAQVNCPVAPPKQLKEPHRFGPAALRHYSQQVLRPAAQPFVGENDSVFCAALHSPFDEADYVAAQVIRLAREGRRFEDMAVIGRDMDQRASTLQAAFDRYGIPYFFDGGETADTMPLIRFVRRYCAMAAGGLPREETLAFFKCGVLPVDAEEIAAFENYTYVWNLSGEDFRRPFEKNPLGFSDRPMGLKERGQLETAEKLRAIAVSAADGLLSRIREAPSLPEGVWAALSDLSVLERVNENIAGLLADGRETDAENQRLAWEVLTAFLDGARQLSCLRSQEGEGELTLREFRELLGLSASCQKLASRPQTLDSVLLGSAQRVRIGSKKVVFAVGAEDRVFPQAPSSSGVFTDRERRALREAGILLEGLMEEKMVEERFVAYETVSAPSELLFITYAAGDVAGKPQPPSALVTGFAEIFPGSAVKAQGKMDPVDFCQSSSTAFLQAARCRGGMGSDAFAASLRAALEEDPLYRPRLQRLEKAEKLGRLVLEDPELCRRMFGGRPSAVEYSGYVLARPRLGSRFLVVERQPAGRVVRLSPSQIERFHSCPFAYFCRYGLGLRPRTRAELNPLARGNVIHYLLERILRRPDFARMTDQQLQELTQRHLAEYLLTVMGGQADKSARFLYYYGRLLTALLGILRALREEFSQTLFTVAGLEEIITQGGVVEPLKIQLPGTEVLVGGKIDRVDWAQLDGRRYVRVVDYKSGRKEFRKDEVEKGLNLQMLLYLFAVWQSSSGKYQGVEPAGILYMPARSADPSHGRDEEGDAADGYRMNGLLLDDETVLRAMEPSLSGRFLPVRMGKSGLTGGKYLETAQGFEDLRREAEGLVARMTQELLSGQVSPNPQKSGQRGPCAFCDYRTVCGREGRDVQG